MRESERERERERRAREMKRRKERKRGDKWERGRKAGSMSFLLPEGGRTGTVSCFETEQATSLYDCLFRKS